MKCLKKERHAIKTSRGPKWHLQIACFAALVNQNPKYGFFFSITEDTSK